MIFRNVFIYYYYFQSTTRTPIGTFAQAHSLQIKTHYTTNSHGLLHNFSQNQAQNPEPSTKSSKSQNNTKTHQL
jgi:hypothetical protein